MLGKARRERYEGASSLQQPPPAPAVSTSHGKKRKSIDSDHIDRTNGQPRKIKAHKRTRTLGDAQNLTSSTNGQMKSSSPHQLDRSVFDSRSLIYKYGDNPEARNMLIGKKMDTTVTDYFKLKALGIDPDTPIIPDTKKSLERKKRKSEDMEPPAVSGVSSRDTKRREVVKNGVPGSRPSATAGASSSPSVPKSTPNPPGYDPDDDKLLAEARELRKTLSEGAAWYHRESERLSSESATPPNNHHHHHKRSSSPLDLLVDSRGMSSVNGYEFRPSTSGIITRTEERLRRTGGRGLAYKAPGTVSLPKPKPLPAARLRGGDVDPAPPNKERPKDIRDRGPKGKGKAGHKEEQPAPGAGSGNGVGVWTGRLRSSTPEPPPPPAASQTQATGASADDAFVLSD